MKRDTQGSEQPSGFLSVVLGHEPFSQRSLRTRTYAVYSLGLPCRVKIPILRLQRRPSNRHVSRALVRPFSTFIQGKTQAKAAGAIESLIKGRRTDRTLTGKRRPPLSSPWGIKKVEVPA